jgi:hypothetical protein
MAQAMSLKKSIQLDERIDQFCEKSAELLTGIHENHSGKGKGSGEPKKKKRGRPRKNDL